MRYTIPTDKAEREKESLQIMRSATAGMAQNLDMTLGFLADNAGENHVYREQDYDNLFSICRSLKLTDGKRKDDMFPPKQRNAETFQAELQKLWQALELYTLGMGKNLLASYQRVEAEPEQCKKLLQEEEALERANPDTKEPAKREQLLDENAKDFQYVSGTVYEDLFKNWDALRKNLDTENYKPAKLLDQDMTDLLARLQTQYLKRNSMDSYVPMNPEEYQEIHKLYQDCVKDLDRLPEAASNPEYGKLHELMAHNELQLGGLSMDSLPPLAEVLDNEPVQTIYLENAENKTVGENLSSREAIEYTDKEGRLHRGFFTADTQRANAKEDAKKILEKYQKKYPEKAEAFGKLFDQKAGMIKAIDDKDNNMLSFTTFFLNLQNSMGLPGDMDFMNAAEQFGEDLRKNEKAHGILEYSGIHEKDHIAERSGAMSDVARALGVPQLIAESRRVTVERDGKQVSGVLMEAAEADSVDGQYLAKGDPFLKLSEKEFDSKVMLSSLADLQILDYLCANTDRHANNFFVRQDASDPEHPKLLGIQGIDNDNSFGDLTDGGRMQLALAQNLKIITETMADAVTAMTQDKLKSILKNYHLSDRQMKSAETRLTRLQNMIQKGREEDGLKIENGKLVNAPESIHIVKDEEWDKLTLDQLIPDKVKRINKDGEEKEVQLKNLFYIAEAKRYDVKYMTNKFNNPYYQPKKKDPIVYTRHEMKIDYEKLGAQQQKELEALQEIQKRFIKHGGNESKRSSKFKTMKTALKRLTEQYEAMERILASEARDKDKQLAEGYKKLNAQREKLNTAIDRYLHKKHFNDISPENQKRIDIAGRLAGITKNAPESENLFASGKALKDRKEASMGAKNVHQLNTYVTNQIYSLMRDTLRTNVDALKQKDPKHALGVNALKAQERLWKYGQMDGADRTMSEDEKKVREQVPFGNLEAEKKLEAAGRPNMDQISRDLNAISLYAPELGEQVNKLMQHKENITPREVKAVLHELLVHESKTAANQKKIARPHVIRTGELGK